LTTTEPACYRDFGLQNWQQIGFLFARLACCAAAAALVAPATANGWSWPVQGPVLHAFSFGSDPYAGATSAAAAAQHASRANREPICCQFCKPKPR
jgi:hypothetical protein